MATRILLSRHPVGRLGHNWLQCFKAQYYLSLHTSWGSAFDSQHADALTPAAVKKYFDMVDEVYKQEDIQTKDQWAADETGMWAGIEGAERVTGRTGTKHQHV